MQIVLNIELIEKEMYCIQKMIIIDEKANPKCKISCYDRFEKIHKIFYYIIGCKKE